MRLTALVGALDSSFIQDPVHADYTELADITLSKNENAAAVLESVCWSLGLVCVPDLHNPLVETNPALIERFYLMDTVSSAAIYAKNLEGQSPAVPYTPASSDTDVEAPAIVSGGELDTSPADRAASVQIWDGSVYQPVAHAAGFSNTETLIRPAFVGTDTTALPTAQVTKLAGDFLARWDRRYH